MAPEPDLVRWRLRVDGIVQGVGFRPHVYQLASGLGLGGFVVNTADGVLIEVEGRREPVARFVATVADPAPPLAQVDTLAREEIAPIGSARFEIRTSVAGAPSTLVAPDVATCAECLAEVSDAGDRRYRYPFANCTNCGPRYTIVTGIPYDRANTTMAAFVMCPACRAEFEDPADRRFHAQPVCCPACGPQLDPSIEEAAAALRAGDVVAVKGLGGYHLAVVASDEQAVARLRARKHREDRPFALMAADLAAVERLATVEPAAATLLTSPARPIVVLPRRPDARVARAVAPGLGELGVMLPYTPLHHLLLEAVGEPIVLTSGNVSDEPIAFEDDDARVRLAGIADRFLIHDRPIHMRVDDSVARIVTGAPYLLRRSRGYVPSPLAVPWAAPRPVLACGAELKSTIAVARGRRVFLSHHLGDLKNYAAYRSFIGAIDHLRELFDIRPEVVAHDLHPEYLSTTYAIDRAAESGLDRVPVQHHHAHIASCLADNGVAGPVIGVAFDGTGYGADGTVWGGEFLVGDAAAVERCGWLEPLPLPGGDAAAEEPWRMAAAYLHRLGRADRPPATIDVAADRWSAVVAMAGAGVRSPPTSSVGRLFDAVAALVGLRTVVHYEGQAAIELEACVARDGREDRAGYPVATAGNVLIGADLVAGVLADVDAGVAVGRIASRFHHGLADGVARVCVALRDETGLTTVALSGGVFANVVLLGAVTTRLTAAGFTVLRHRRVPCNDGGISFGQVAVVAARDRLAGASRRTT
jgi:hydrogenase maturation protein HypF